MHPLLAALKAAGFAAFLSFWWSFRTLLFGADTLAREASLLGLAIGGGAAMILVARLGNFRLSLKKRFFLLAPFLGFWILLLALSSTPYSLAYLFPAPENGQPVLLAGLELALFFFLPALAFAGFARDLLDHLPYCLLGAAFGLAVQDLFLLPVLGWIPSSLIWMALLVGTHYQQGAAEKPVPEMKDVYGIPFALVWGVCAGALFGITILFVSPAVSATQFSETVLIAMSLTGLGLGGLVATSFGQQALPVRWRGIALGLSVLLAIPLSLFILGKNAQAGFTEEWKDFFAQGGVPAELLILLIVTGIPTLLLGAGLSSILFRRTQLVVLGLAFAAGTGLGPKLMPEQMAFDMVHLGYGQPMHDRQITPEGIHRVVRAVHGEYGSIVHWNRSPISRNDMWQTVEENEIYLPIVLSTTRGSTLLVGTPFAAHRTALGSVGLTDPEVLFPIPNPPDIGTDLEATESDPFRFVARGLDKKYAIINILSYRSLASGGGSRLGYEYLEQLASKLHPEGKLFLWLDLRAFRDVGPVLKTFFALFPEGRLWLAQEGIAGPLLCLESSGGTQPDLPDGVPTYFLGKGSGLDLSAYGLNSLARPRVESHLPLSIPPHALALPETLRQVAAITNPGKRGPSWFWFDGLALHAENQTKETFYFLSALERVRITEQELQQWTVGISTFPENRMLRENLYSIGRLVLKKKDYDLALRFFKEWVDAVPTDGYFRYLLGRADHEMQDHELALQNLQEAAAIKSDYIEIHEALGSTHAALDQVDEAVESYSRAASMEPKNPKYPLRIGKVLFEAKRYARAKEFLLQAKAMVEGVVGTQEKPEINEYLDKIEEVEKKQ